jgi:hypothetical protein
VPQDAAIEFFGFADSDVNYGSESDPEVRDWE